MCSQYLLLESEDGVVGGVEEDSAVPEAKNLAFDLEHDVSIDIGDCEVALCYGQELPHDG